MFVTNKCDVFATINVMCLQIWLTIEASLGSLYDDNSQLFAEDLPQLRLSFVVISHASVNCT